jgi:hypothetical protein
MILFHFLHSLSVVVVVARAARVKGFSCGAVGVGWYLVKWTLTIIVDGKKS